VHGQESKPRSFDHKSDALTTTLPSHPAVVRFERYGTLTPKATEVFTCIIARYTNTRRGLLEVTVNNIQKLEVLKRAQTSAKRQHNRIVAVLPGSGW